MKTREGVANRILQLCFDRRLAVNALAHQAGMAPTTLKNIISGVSRNPGIVTIKIICDGLGISLTEFFDTEEFRSLEQEDI